MHLLIEALRSFDSSDFELLCGLIEIIPYSKENFLVVKNSLEKWKMFLDDKTINRPYLLIQSHYIIFKTLFKNDSNHKKMLCKKQ